MTSPGTVSDRYDAWLRPDAALVVLRRDRRRVEQVMPPVDLEEAELVGDVADGVRRPLRAGAP